MDTKISAAARSQAGLTRKIRLTIQKAEALERKSSLTSSFRSPRWYAAVSVDGSPPLVTKTVKTANPIWGQSFEFDLGESSVVKVKIMDGSSLGPRESAHGLVAEVSVRPSVLMQKERAIEHGFYLNKPGTEIGARVGILHIRIEYMQDAFATSGSSLSPHVIPPKSSSRLSRTWKLRPLVASGPSSDHRLVPSPATELGLSPELALVASTASSSHPPQPHSASKSISSSRSRRLTSTPPDLDSLEHLYEAANAGDNIMGRLTIGKSKSTAISATSSVTAWKSNSAFGSVCQYVETLLSIGGALAEIHPWASLAWSVLSTVPKIMVAEMQRDLKVQGLWQVASDMLDFLGNAETVLQDLQDNFQAKTVSAMMQQIYDCALFVREYSGKGFLKRTLRDTFSDSSDKAISLYTTAFQQLKSQFSSRLELSSVKIFADVRVGMISVGDTLEVLTTLERTKILEALPGTNLLHVRCDERRTCLPGTRMALLDALAMWVVAAETNAPNVFYLYGQSGTGKSTIANTVSAQFNALGRLGASFCFRPPSGLNMENDAAAFAGNLAYQLALFNKAYRAALLDVLDRKGRMNIHPLRDQLEHYVVTPLASVEFCGPVVLVLDGVDSSGDAQDSPLSAIIDVCAQLPPFIKLLVTSRQPADVPDHLEAHVEAHSLDDPVAAYSDIALYTRDRLVGVARKHGVPEAWLETIDVSLLAQCAGSLFIWATVMCNYLRRSHDLDEALAKVLSVGESGAAEETLGQLYELAAENGSIDSNVMSSERSLTPVSAPGSRRPHASPLSTPSSQTSSVSSVSVSSTLSSNSLLTETEASSNLVARSPAGSLTKTPRRFMRRLLELWPPLEQTGSDPLPLFRAWRFDDHHDHFYTTDPAELHFANCHRYRIEGAIGLIHSIPVLGTVPLYRMRSPGSMDHFYTISSAERDRVLSIYKDEGVAGYVYPKEIPGTIPFYRLFCSSTGDHFYTASASEKVIAINHCQYTDQGIAAWILSNPEPPEPVVFHRCWSASLRNHFYTANYEEARYTAREVHWTAEPEIGCIFLSEAPGTVPLFRMYSWGSSDHFYTTDGGEYERARGSFYPEGIAGYVYPNLIPGAVPLYRLWNSLMHDHFYTTSRPERDRAIAQVGYADEGIAAYILPPTSCPAKSPAAAPIPLFRAYNCDTNDHYYTTDLTDMVNSSEVHMYRLEGCVGRVLPTARPGTLPLYHLSSPRVNDHFYTTDAAERDSARPGYTKDHGIEGYVYPTQADGAIPLFRLYSSSIHDHFYTTSEMEKIIAINHLRYTDEGVAGYILPSLLTPQHVPFLRCFFPNTPDHFYCTNSREMRRAADSGARSEEDAGRIFAGEAPGTVPLFRLYANGDHFYTTDAIEHDRAVNVGWKCESVAGWVYPHEVPGSIPLHRLWSLAMNDHMYTVSQAERDLLIAQLGYVSEGVAAYVLPA